MDEMFSWTPKCEVAFHTLRTLLTIAPILAQPDIEKPFDVFCDASGIGWGVCSCKKEDLLPMLLGN